MKKKRKVTNNANVSKKPNEKDFRAIVKALGGNLTKVADYYGVSRQTIYDWQDADPALKSVVRDERTKLFDEVLATSRVVALGIPKYEHESDPNTGEVLYDENGKPKKIMVGWAVYPDSNMLRYFMSKLGKKDGFGDEPEDDGFTVKNGVNIRAWIQKENEG